MTARLRNSYNRAGRRPTELPACNLCPTCHRLAHTQTVHVPHDKQRFHRARYMYHMPTKVPRMRYIYHEHTKVPPASGTCTTYLAKGTLIMYVYHMLQFLKPIRILTNTHRLWTHPKNAKGVRTTCVCLFSTTPGHG